jgi:hypothetical protein
MLGRLVGVGRQNVTKTYRLDRTGRRTALLLTLGAAIVWIFALWKLPDVLSSDTLRVRYLDPGAWAAVISQGLTVTQIVPALLLLVLIIATPLLLWNLIEEWFTTYTVRPDGLVYDTVQGISVVYNWNAIKSLRPVDPEATTPVYELIVDGNGVCQINNPVLRWLHSQAWSRGRIPIYAHVTDRDELLDEIVTRAKLAISRQQSAVSSQ